MNVFIIIQVSDVSIILVDHLARNKFDVDTG